MQEDQQLSVEQWLEIRKQAAKKIDPETAEVMWDYAQTVDPYGVRPDLWEEHWCVGRENFARSPASEIWVWFGDLSEAVETALWQRHRRKLGFSAGLSGEDDEFY